MTETTTPAAPSLNLWIEKRKNILKRFDINIHFFFKKENVNYTGSC
jgi:hypothetical protein